MFNFTHALMHATYQNGKPGKPTDAHQKAEFHRFKTEYLFKETQIPKEGYVSRLIQQLLIIEAIEQRLQHFSVTEQSEIRAFFALSYLSALWRTPGMQEDLRQLGHSRNQIKQHDIAKSTQAYVNYIGQLSPKQALTHFLVHVAGFIHGGKTICSKYIVPSNKITQDQITSHQYDFNKTGRSDLFSHLMSHVDQIPLDDTGYAEIRQHSEDVYKRMVTIYDDLWDMHVHHPESVVTITRDLIMVLAVIKLCLMILNFVIQLEFDVPTDQCAALPK